MLRSLIVTAFFAASLGLAPALAQNTNITVEDAWSRATAPRQPTGATFLTINNSGNTPDRLIGVASPAAETAGVHRTVNENGVLKMRPAGVVEIPANANVALAPGGLHIMLIGLTQPLKKGRTLPITLTFEQAGAITIEAAIQGAGAKGPPR